MCSLNYERLGDSCIRVSTIPLAWGEAEVKCKEEGGHLISIMSSQTQTQLMDLIKMKIANNEKTFLPPYADEIENYWTGGTVRSINDWRWISTLKNFSEFSLWKSAKQGFGCPSDLCLETHALKVSGDVFYWVAEEKSRKLPYICESSCRLGYIWQKRSKKCVKIERVAKKTQSEASLFCEKDQGKLISVNSCLQLQNLIEDLRFFWKSPTEKYWIGFYFGLESTRSSPGSWTLRGTDSRGRPGIDRQNCPDVKFIDETGGDFSPIDREEYSGLLQYSQDSSLDDQVTLVKAGMVDGSPSEMFLCEQDDDWACESGYLSHGPSCLKMIASSVTAGEAELICQEEGAEVLELQSVLTLNFLTQWMKEQSPEPEGVYLAYMRHTNTRADTENMEYLSFSGERTFDNQKFNLLDDPNISGDCLILSNAGAIKQVDCQEKHNAICSKPQSSHKRQELSWPLEVSSQLSLPLDRETGLDPLRPQTQLKSQGSHVAITDTLSPSGLKGAASFMRTDTSFIRTHQDVIINTKQGLTILAWVYLSKQPLGNERSYIFDGVSEEGGNSVEFYIHNSDGSLFLGLTLCTRRDQPGTCSVFESHESMALTLNTWHYVGVTCSSDDIRGTFIVQETFGSKDGEGTYFTLNNSMFSAMEPLTGPFIGIDKDLNRGFGGDISCLQVYQFFIKPSLAMDLKDCPVPADYKKFQNCPDGYIIYKNVCFLISQESLDFSNAEFFCSSQFSHQR